MRSGLTIISVLTLCFALWFGFEAVELPGAVTLGEPGPGRIPLIAAVLIGAMGVFLLLQSFRQAGESTAAYPQLPRVALMGGAGIAYAALIPVLGYYLATPIFLLPTLLLLRTSWRAAIGVTAGFTLFVFLVFDKLLRVPLP